MKIKLYKYTSHIKSFIDKPLLRATRAQDLNDPFELNPNSNLLDFIINTRNLPSEVLALFGDKKKYFELSMAREKGIISLSECKDNLLMWSHYSNSHKGGVIEFTFDIEMQKHSRSPVQRGFFKSLADNNYQYGIVKYKKNRTIDTSLLNGNGYELTGQIIDNLAFIKSKEWMYEEEHRFLINLNYCDITLIEDTSENRKELDKYDLSVNLIDAKLAIPPKHDFKALDSSIFPFANNLLDRSKYMQFIAIKESCVTGIYLGANMPEKDFNDIVKANKKLAKFENLDGNLYRTIIHSDAYDLEFKKLQKN